MPNEPGTRFGIGSITKAMTEIVVDALVDERRLDLDAPAAGTWAPFRRSQGAAR